MNIKKTKIWGLFSSIKLAIWLLGLIALFSLFGTLILQNREPAEYIAKYGHFFGRLFLKTGLTNVYSAWWFILPLALLSVNLITCLFNRFSLKPRTMGTFISHVSVLVILAGALIGTLYGEKGYMRIIERQTVSSFMPSKGDGHEHDLVKLDFFLRLDDFIYEENINTQEKLSIYSRENKLLDEIATDIGKRSTIGETGFSIEILRYVPNFVMDVATKKVTTRSAEPRNPAIEVRLQGEGDDVRTFWVFAAHPSVHNKKDNKFILKYKWVRRRPKDFLSKITVIKDGKEVISKDVRVNFPLKFGGYTFFQSSYDKEHLTWTGLQIVKDPGVPAVYLGFILLILGLCIRFYINPLIKNK